MNNDTDTDMFTLIWINYGRSLQVISQENVTRISKISKNALFAVGRI